MIPHDAFWFFSMMNKPGRELDGGVQTFCFVDILKQVFYLDLIIPCLFH